MKNNFDSNEELYFSWYLDQLKDKGYVNHWERNEASYEMTSPIINTKELRTRY